MLIGVLRYDSRNDGIVFYAEGDPGDPGDLGEGLFFIDHGRIVEEIAPDGSILSTDFRSGDVTNICTALS